jgi:aspartate aminotransferase
MFQIMTRARELERDGKPVVHLEIGDPDYSLTRNLDEIVAAELRAGNGRYVASQGLSELLTASAQRFGSSRGFVPDATQMLVTPGANIQIFLLLSCIADVGDRVLLPNPGFVTYREHCVVAGVEPVFYSLHEKNGFQPDLNELETLIKSDVKAIILNSPHNPTGVTYSEEVMRAIFDLCRRKNVFIISDEVYSRQVFDGAKFYSPSRIDSCRERVFVVHSLSKTFGLTGWRIGVLTGPSAIMEAVRLASEAMISCVPPFIQVAAAHVLSSMNHTANEWIARINSRRALFREILTGVPGISLCASDSTFYLLGRLCCANADATVIAEHLLEERFVAVVPGDHFGSLGKGYLRFALTSDDQSCAVGAQRLADFFGDTSK